MLKVILLNTNGTYSHLIQYLGIKEAFEQLKQENVLDFIEVNISVQDGPEIDKFNADWIFLVSPLAAGFRVHKKYRNKKVICFDTESVYENLGIDSLPYCDIMATVDKFGSEIYREHIKLKNLNCKVYHMPLGFSPSLYKFQNVEDSYKSDVCMIGVMFDRRVKVIENLYRLKDLIKLRVITAKGWESRIIHPTAITYYHKDVVSPEDMVKYYCGAKIILCINRDYSPSNKLGEKSTTPGRVFQETACRRMTMIDKSRPEVFDYFEDGKEIVTFDENNSDDLREKIIYYLNHDTEREEIAHNGCVRTMRDNTWKKRLEGLFNFIKTN